MGFDKTFAQLDGQPVIAHTIAAFETAECVAEIILVGQAERLGDLRELSAEQRFAKVKNIVAGGVHRQDSVAAGLAALASSCEYVAVQDAARPLVSAAQIARVLEAARLHGAAALAAPVADTLKRTDGDHFVSGSVERENVYAMQTPQIFRREILEQAVALVAARQLSITDDVSAVQHLGRKVFLVLNDEPNLKITFPADLALAEALLTHRRCSTSRASTA